MVYKVHIGLPSLGQREERLRYAIRAKCDSCHESKEQEHITYGTPGRGGHKGTCELRSEGLMGEERVFPT